MKVIAMTNVELATARKWAEKNAGHPVAEAYRNAAQVAAAFMEPGNVTIGRMIPYRIAILGPYSEPDSWRRYIALGRQALRTRDAIGNDILKILEKKK